MPPFPRQLSALWDIFLLVLRRRSYAYGAINPLTYTELHYFQEQTLYELSAWEVDLVMRLEETSRAAYDHKPTTEPEIDEVTGNPAIPITNTKAIRALFRGIAIRKAVQFKEESNATDAASPDDVRDLGAE